MSVFYTCAEASKSPIWLDRISTKEQRGNNEIALSGVRSQIILNIIILLLKINFPSYLIFKNDINTNK